MDKDADPTIIKIQNGWLARGNGWAVRADTREEAMRLFDSQERRHAEVDARVARVPVDDGTDKPG
jgi:hypothetical protein